METKQKITCPYCAAQGIPMMASLQKSKALEEENVRYGCANEHYFAVARKHVQHSETGIANNG